MTILADRIRDAVRDVLHGDVGSVRTVAADTWLYGTFDGMGDMAERSQALSGDAGANDDPPHRFNVTLGRLTAHEASPVAAIGSYRIGLVPVDIDIVTHTKSKAQQTERNSAIARVRNDGDTAVQALAFPGNLAVTAAAAATGVLSGMLVGPGGEGTPEHEVVAEEWDRNIIRSRIRGAALISITQATS